MIARPPTVPTAVRITPSLYFRQRRPLGGAAVSGRGRKNEVTDLLPGTASGLLPVRVAACSDWLEEEELEDLASLRGWKRCSSRGCGLLHTTI